MKGQKIDARLGTGFSVVAALILSALVLRAATALAGEPTDQLRGTVDRVMSVLQDPQLKSTDRQKERRQRLNEIISARFDFPEMASRSLGAEWRRISPAQRQEFVRLFTDLLRNAYAGSIESYQGETVYYSRESRDENYAVVETTLHSPDGAQYAIDYRLHRVEGEWKVYDVIIENISMVNNYRAQFSRVINRSSFDGLLRTLRSRIEQGQGA